MPKLHVVRTFFLFIFRSNVKFLGTKKLIFLVLSSETVAKTGMILLAGEVTSRATVDYQKVVRDTIRLIGYDDSSKGVTGFCFIISALCFFSVSQASTFFLLLLMNGGFIC